MSWKSLSVTHMLSCVCPLTVLFLASSIYMLWWWDMETINSCSRFLLEDTRTWTSDTCKASNQHTHCSRKGCNAAGANGKNNAKGKKWGVSVGKRCLEDRTNQFHESSVRIYLAVCIHEAVFIEQRGKASHWLWEWGILGKGNQKGLDAYVWFLGQYLGANVWAGK